jgi:hypothetical protein
MRIDRVTFASSSDTKVGFGGGGGVAYGVGAGSTRTFLEAKVTTVTLNGVNLASISLRVGLQFGTK